MAAGTLMPRSSSLRSSFLVKKLLRDASDAGAGSSREGQDGAPVGDLEGGTLPGALAPVPVTSDPSPSSWMTKAAQTLMGLSLSRWYMPPTVA